MRKIFEKLTMVLPFILATLTGHKRYKPEIEWSDKSWTHNVFRFYELIFWRRYGIRHEMSARTWIDKKGRQQVVYTCYSFESMCALFEQRVRGLIPELKPVKLIIPQLSTAAPQQSLFGPFMFAVAYDNSGESLSVGTNPLTLSFTVTGSNPYLVSEFGWDFPQTLSAATYNSVAMTAVGSDQLTQSGATYENTYYLAGPATGSNTLSLTISSTSGGRSIDCASYTGVKQVAPPATSTQSVTNAASPLTGNITTTETDSWIVWGFGISGAASAGTNCTKRQQELSYHGAGIADTNSAQGAPGSKTMTLTYGGTLWQNGYQVELPQLPPSVIKSVSGVPLASIKSVSGVAIASIKSILGVSNV